MLTTRFLDIPPLARVVGTVRVPGSKSISNRVLLLAGFAAGTTRIEGLLDADDTQAMSQALIALGCRIERHETHVEVTGLAGRPHVAMASLDLGNAGTAMRPLAAALALCAGLGQRYELHGTPRMHERPIGDLVDALRSLGAAVTYLGRAGYPPLRVEGTQRIGGGPDASGQAVRVRGDVSSQFLSALLLALPLRHAGAASVVEVEGELISRPYVELTLKLLARFGVAVERDGWQRFRVPEGARVESPGRIAVEGDASSASYFVAAAAVAAAATNPLHIEGVGSDSMQGDLAFVDAVESMGAVVTRGPDWLDVARGAWPLRALTIDCTPLPDAAMTLAALALFAEGTTRLDGIASWRVKESDRIATMAEGLRRVGAGVVEGDDFIEVTAPLRRLPATIETYDDHRVAMAMSLAAFDGPAGTAGLGRSAGVRIVDPRCVGKTWPGYFEALFAVATTPAEAIPVLTIDGPTASGKGTLSSRVAAALGYRYLDSGAVYRATAIAALDAGIDAGDEASLAALAQGMALHFEGDRTWLGPRDVTESLRLEAVGALASRISAFPEVRAALLGVQLAFRGLPGLVADGRDMGTVLFPDASLKIFLTAGTAERAARRHKQLIQKGISANIDSLRADLEARDERDRSRSASPLMPAEDALMLDNSALTIDESVAAVLEAWQQRRPFDRPRS